MEDPHVLHTIFAFTMSFILYAIVGTLIYRFAEMKELLDWYMMVYMVLILCGALALATFLAVSGVQSL